MVAFELPALIAIAELKLVQGHSAEARPSLDDDRETAGRGRYPLHQADAYNVPTDVEPAEGDKLAAIAAATDAYRAAWCPTPQMRVLSFPVDVPRGAGNNRTTAARMKFERASDPLGNAAKCPRGSVGQEAA